MMKRLLLALFAACFSAAALSAAPDVPDPFTDELRGFERDLDEIERSLLVAASSKSGSALQKDMEKRLSEFTSRSRRLQLALGGTREGKRFSFTEPVNRLSNVFSKLHQGKERPARALTLRRTSNGEFHRAKRGDITKIQKSEGSPAEKAAAIEDLYDEWLSTVKNDNLRRCGRVSSENLRALYEDYALALFDLRHLIREIRRNKVKAPAK